MVAGMLKYCILVLICLAVSCHANYNAHFEAKTVHEQMTVYPYFSPDSTVPTLISLMDSANSSLAITLQYMKKWGPKYQHWDNDTNILVQAVMRAKRDRGVDVRVIVEQGADDDNVGGYFLSNGIGVRYLNTTQLKWNHNKAIIADRKITSLSSANWSKQGLTMNREAGIQVTNPALAEHFLRIFDYDFDNGLMPTITDSQTNQRSEPLVAGESTDADVSLLTSESGLSEYTPIPINEFPVFDSVVSVTGFSNPDSSRDTILSILRKATQSIYVEIYAINRQDIVQTLVNHKQTKPNMDIKVIISNTRVSASENQETEAAAATLIAAGIEVYLSSEDLKLTHAKFWIVDHKSLVVYSGNWKHSSISDDSTAANREWGIAVNDHSAIGKYYLSIFASDLKIATVYANSTSSPIADVRDSSDLAIGLTASIVGIVLLALIIGLATFIHRRKQYNHLNDELALDDAEPVYDQSMQAYLRI